MGLFSNKSGGRELPDYFQKDQVGGLSHLLRMHQTDERMLQYKAIADQAYDPEYALTCRLGLIILYEPDKKKYEALDYLVEQNYPEMPPRTHEQDQGLLSLLLYRSIVPFHPRGALEVLVPGDRSRERAEMYIEAIFFPMERMADDYLRSIGHEVEREPIRPSDYPDLGGEEQADDLEDRSMRGEINFFK